MKARQLKARDVKLWITLFKSALKSERSNSGRASRWRKEVKLKTGESCTAESEETVAGTGGKKGRKPFFSICVSNEEKQTGDTQTAASILAAC